jgi:hypothetical protein
MVSLPVWSVGQVANISMGSGSQSHRQDDIIRQSDMLGSGRFQPKIVCGVRSTDTSVDIATCRECCFWVNFHIQACPKLAATLDRESYRCGCQLCQMVAPKGVVVRSAFQQPACAPCCTELFDASKSNPTCCKFSGPNIITRIMELGERRLR